MKEIAYRSRKQIIGEKSSARKKKYMPTERLKIATKYFTANEQQKRNVMKE